MSRPSSAAGPLRLCFVIPAFSDGGAQKQCIFLLNQLRHDVGLDITLVHFHGGVHEDLLQRDGLRVIHMPVRSNYDPRNILALRRIVKQIDAQIMMTWLHGADVIGFFTRRLSPRLRWIMAERDSSYPADPRYILRRMLGRHAEDVIANSAKGADYWRQAGAGGALHVVSNIVDARIGAVAPGRPRRIVTIGRLEPQKNARTVVEAFILLAGRHPDLEFAVIGGGSEAESLQALVREKGLQDRIAFLGFRKDVIDQIHASGLVVSMSHHEGLPNVMLESVGAHRLVVASDIPEHRELLGGDYPYLVADRDNPQAVAEGIEAAMAQMEDTAPLAHAHERLRAMTPEAVAEAYRRIFTSGKA
ncbi:glycosyltransferase [Novosphingobium terrae]|uniref:glycosyltransferase n=1 Tax=Novosphingobium terrae TaxID=2726189 RepID=UPI0019808030|nr:glycosyltransferase [Novosphingobium terrae]